MHRPLGRAALLVFAPFAFAGAQAHCLARLAARFHKQSLCSGFSRLGGFRSCAQSLQSHRCGVIVAWL